MRIICSIIEIERKFKMIRKLGSLRIYKARVTRIRKDCSRLNLPIQLMLATYLPYATFGERIRFIKMKLRSHIHFFIESIALFEKINKFISDFK